jgi:hypothetical protein
MIYADIHGKNHVPEDVLTSNCLGLLHMLPDCDMLDFLSEARSYRDQDFVPIPTQPTAEVTLDFWPHVSRPRGCIPDAILRIPIEATQTYTVIIEAKHTAEQSGDQLSDYWKAGNAISPGRFTVIYLTGHASLPKAELQKSETDADPSAKIYWIGWRDLFKWTQRKLSCSAARPYSEIQILQMLSRYLTEKEYRTFLGWDRLAAVSGKYPYRRKYGLSGWASSVPPRSKPCWRYIHRYVCPTAKLGGSVISLCRYAPGPRQR